MMTSKLRLAPVTDSHREWEQRTGGTKATALLFADIVIVDKRTGEQRLHVDDTGFAVAEGEDVLDAVDGARYMWLWGNYGCDCNRALMFARVNGEEDTASDCGHERFGIIEPDWTHIERINPAPLGAGDGQA